MVRRGGGGAGPGRRRRVRLRPRAGGDARRGRARCRTGITRRYFALLPAAAQPRADAPAIARCAAPRDLPGPPRHPLRLWQHRWTWRRTCCTCAARAARAARCSAPALARCAGAVAPAATGSDHFGNRGRPGCSSTRRMPRFEVTAGGRWSRWRFPAPPAGGGDACPGRRCAAPARAGGAGAWQAAEFRFDSPMRPGRCRRRRLCRAELPAGPAGAGRAAGAERAASGATSPSAPASPTITRRSPRCCGGARASARTSPI